MQDNESAEKDSQPSQESPEKSVEKISITLPIKEPGSGHKKTFAIVLLVVVVFAAVGWLVYTLLAQAQTKPQQNTETHSLPEKTEILETVEVEGLTLDPAKDYGNRYADGVLPVGDDKYTTDTAKKGHIYACSQYAQSFKSDNIGADTRGPWFVNNNTEYDINKKISVKGNVSWKGSFSNKISDSIRTIITNDLPLAHSTGTFPVASSDPAYSYDKNPNSISSQELTYKLSAKPTYGEPRCMDGEVGVMLTGVSLFNGFDAGARDAGAWEVQDACEGHPQKSGQYHYHTLSSCINDTSVSTVIGFAIDGFPITGPKVGSKNVLTTSDLDVCHGITSEITLDGKSVTMYHYVMTQDFPYSVSCFRGEKGESAGTNEGGSQSNQKNIPPQSTPGQNSPPTGPPPPKL